MSTFLAPVSDLAVGTWVTTGNATTNLFTQVDEITSDDADYISTPLSTVASTYRTRLATPPVAPPVDTGHVLHIRYKVTSGNADMTLRLKQGATVIWSKTYTNVGTGLLQADEPLTTAQAALITNYSLLDLEAEFIIPTPPSDPLAGTRPSWVTFDSTPIVSFDGLTMSGYPNVTLQSVSGWNIAISNAPGTGTYYMNSNRRMPQPFPETAFLTIYQKFGTDFNPGDGGKLPGLCNTGDAWPGGFTLNGVTYPDGAYGESDAEGVHWAQRNHWSLPGTSVDVIADTFMTVLTPLVHYAFSQVLPWRWPKGRWVAYVQGLKLNTFTGTTANTDGALYLEFFGPTRKNYVYSPIKYRSIKSSVASEDQWTRITECTIVYYSGGTVGPARGTCKFARADVTVGMPDIATVQNNVDFLNSVAP